MTPLLARVGAWLVEPAAGVPRPRRAHVRAVAPPAAADLAVLAAPADAPALAAALALRVARGAAVVGLWPAARVPALPATPAARRLASSLAPRGLAGTAAGRLVTVPLADAASAARLRGAVTGVPLVLAVAAPRDDAWDRLLVDCDLVVAHACEAAVADLAVARLTEQGATAVRVGGPPGVAARVLARAGLALPGGLAALGPALEAAGR
jgi:hypothetical protein